MRRHAFGFVGGVLGFVIACGDAGPSDDEVGETDDTGSTTDESGSDTTTDDEAESSSSESSESDTTDTESDTTDTTETESDTTETTDTTDTGDECVPTPPDEFVTYLGGGDFEHGRDLAYDCEGNLYVAGGTRSNSFPHTLGGPEGGVDVFVAKYDPSGALVWAHRFGSPNYDRAYALEIDGQGDVVVAGRAGNGLTTTDGALQSNFGGDMDAAAAYGGQDGFVAKLSSDGAILWTTYFGSSGRDFIRDLALDDHGDVYVAASQVTRDHPHITGGSFDGTRSGMDCVAAKLSADGNAVIWAGYLGGIGDDCPEPSIRVDPISETPVMIIGTDADDLPDTPGAFQAGPSGAGDVFVAKIAAHGSSLEFGTYVGGSNGDGLETHNIALMPDGRVVLGIVTLSTDLPTTPGVIQPTYGGTGGNGSGVNTNYPGDGWIGVLAADGSEIEIATYLGGTLGDAVEGIAIAPDGRVYVSGGSFSANFPLGNDPYQAIAAGNLEAFVAILAPDLQTLHYASFVGGSNWDVARAVAIGPNDQIAATGETRSNDLSTTPNAEDSMFGGNGEFDTLVVQLVP
jgi:hypothetical protein